MTNIKTYTNPTAEMVAGIDIKKIIHKLLNDLDISDKSKNIYKECLVKFFRWIREEEIGEGGYISRIDILAYKKYLRENYSADTSDLRLTAVRLLFSWLEANRISPDITRGIKGFKKNDNTFVKDNLTQEQIVKLTNRGGERVEEVSNLPIVTSMSINGLRSIEVERANIENLRNGRSGGYSRHLNSTKTSRPQDFCNLHTSSRQRE